MNLVTYSKEALDQERQEAEEKRQQEEARQQFSAGGFPGGGGMAGGFPGAGCMPGGMPGGAGWGVPGGMQPSGV